MDAEVQEQEELAAKWQAAIDSICAPSTQQLSWRYIP